MAMVLYTILASSTWIVLWAIGSKPIDAFLVAIVIMLVAVAHQMIGPHLPGKRPS